MKSKDLIKLGIPPGEAVNSAVSLLANASEQGLTRHELLNKFMLVAADPSEFVNDSCLGELATHIVEYRSTIAPIMPFENPVHYVQFGHDLDEDAISQLVKACRLPVSIAGALMPDAHVGYGLPIGGVLATDNAVIPFAVGVDIACRMKMTVLDLPVSHLEEKKDGLTSVLQRETAFGIGASFKRRKLHPVMDDDWLITKITSRLKDKAWKQLGTSGSGNHFVEYGTLSVLNADMGLEPGKYLAVLSHSGSRGAGQEVAKHYSEIANQHCKGLPHEFSRLSWLSLDSEDGQEYWNAMNLMGRYAAANHELIHRDIAKALGATVLCDIENHHNFAWKESYRGRDVIVHRKGATPASRGLLGIIPGSMASPGFVVRGKGNASSLSSASHGAGRAVSRTKAKELFDWTEAKTILSDRGVTLISAGLDEVPMAYKDIEKVMAAQAELVTVLARFDPKLVKMAPAGERPED